MDKYSISDAYRDAMSYEFDGKHFKVALAYIEAFRKNIIDDIQLREAFDIINEHAIVIADEYPDYSDTDYIVDYVEHRLSVNE